MLVLTDEQLFGDRQQNVRLIKISLSPPAMLHSCPHISQPWVCNQTRRHHLFHVVGRSCLLSATCCVEGGEETRSHRFCLTGFEISLSGSWPHLVGGGPGRVGCCKPSDVVFKGLCSRCTLPCQQMVGNCQEQNGLCGLSLENHLSVHASMFVTVGHKTGTGWCDGLGF